MSDAINFDATTVAPRSTPDPVPNDWYRAMIVESAVKPTKKQDGRYLQLDWQILDGPHKGRIVWDRLNVQNPNETAQKIGQEQLSAVCHTLGVLKLQNSSQLHNIPAMIKVVVKQDPGQDPQNEVKKYKAIEGAAPAAKTAPAGAPPAAAAAPAWAQKKAS
jgi:hypothetical protein